MNISQTISKGISEYVFNLCEKISTDHNIPLENLLIIWCEQQNVSFNTEFGNMVKLSKKQRKISSTIIEKKCNEEDELSEKMSSLSTEDELTCNYVFIRGSKKGQRCQIVAKTGNFCSKHKKS